MSAYGIADPGVRGDRHHVFGCADELARERAMALARVARAPRARRPRKRRKWAGLEAGALLGGRRDLERVALAQVAQLQRDPLARAGVAVGIVDEQAQGLAADDLGEQHLDVRSARRGRASMSSCKLFITLLPGHKKAERRPLRSCTGRSAASAAGPRPQAVLRNVAPCLRCEACPFTPLSKTPP